MMGGVRAELKTERLLIRPFRFEDVEYVFSYASDPEWVLYDSELPQPFTKLDAERYLAQLLLTSWGSHPAFAIVLDSKVIGEINLTIDKTSKTADLGFGISSVHWGKGIAAEAARAVIGWGFEQYGLAKIAAGCDLRNRRSLRVMEKVGMVREGVHRSQYLERGERIDSVSYGLLREEWENNNRT